ncbi:MAG: molybdopterin biosynthesis protein [Deltaproteobacteria bacterium]|nr:molybdopterin biosynthesis protein [Deltaproteobacteria bacterium]
MKQEQFLSVVTAEEATRIFREAIQPGPLGEEEVSLSDSLGRVLSRNIVSRVDVPFFDRSNVDGFAIRSQDSFGADETSGKSLQLTGEVIHTNVVPRSEISPGKASAIATGGVIPRGADAVIMVEDTKPDPDAPDGQGIIIYKGVVPGNAISFAGTDIASGETVLHSRFRLTSRETGVLAAIGYENVPVFRRPRVAIISTGDEIIPPGKEMHVGRIYDSNGTIIRDAVRELGCEADHLGIVPDHEPTIRKAVEKAVAEYDFVLLSGGTSKGEGDLNYAVVNTMGAPGILVHGVALKPGKPLCLALIGKTPLAILPGFPTSAVFTFHAFIAPVLRIMAGEKEEDPQEISARLPMRVNSAKGRTEFLLVNLVDGRDGYSAYPMGKGSGSVTTFSKADGFICIDRNAEYLEGNEQVNVTLIGQKLKPADLVVIGSQCVGLDYILAMMSREGWRVKFIAVGSTGGLTAAARGECDIAGSHLLDEKTGIYNQPFLDDSLHLEKGYGRRQGLVFRKDDDRFGGLELQEALTLIKTPAAPLAGEGSPDGKTSLMINRNRGSGTRILIDKLLDGQKPQGYLVEAKSHNAVAAAVAQGRADWGVAINHVAEQLGLGFLFIVNEEYDFVIPRARQDRPAVKAFLSMLHSQETQKALQDMGFAI